MEVGCNLENKVLSLDEIRQFHTPIEGLSLPALVQSKLWHLYATTHKGGISSRFTTQKTLSSLQFLRLEASRSAHFTCEPAASDAQTAAAFTS